MLMLLLTTPTTELGNNLSIYLNLYYRLTDFSFLGSFNMGYEGFSKPLPLARMHPVYGNKGEWLFLLGLFALVPIVKSSRKKNEDALRATVKANNRYEVMNLSHQDRQPSKWTA